MTAGNMIRLMRPRLPRHETILPYWQEIDADRIYSNFGPLSMRLEKRMTEFFRQKDGCVVTVGNGTAGLTNILRAFNLPRGSYCLLPSWTFIATPASVVSAGLVPYFLDVDEKTWALSPDKVREHVLTLGNKVGAVMVVAPFGAPLDCAAWDRLTEETGIPVIIDAAAGFDAFSTEARARPGKNPVMISLHATKALGIGEGGIVISSDTELITRVREMSNFGFSESRIITVPGTNGKMSEYHAAVGHAALDEWAEKRAEFFRVKAEYARAIKEAGLPVHAPSLEGDWISSTLSVQLPGNTADDVIRKLHKAGVESRSWWGKGCHTQPAYMFYPKAELPDTEKLGHSVTALPFWCDMPSEDIRKVVDTLGTILQEAHYHDRAYA